jgi:GWxTD domain-containing protein
VRPWHWIARVLDDGGQVVAEQDSVGAAARTLEAGPALDLSREPAGGYDLEVKAWQDGDSGAVLRRAHLSVAWKRDSWERNPRDVEDDVHFLLSADDEEAFAKLHPGEQERYLEKFWRERDPTPETAENEARDAFLDRVKYANKIYTRAGIGPGMFSDMGRVYIRYGPPGEVFRQVLPSGDESLRQVVRELALMEDRPIDGVSPRGIGADIRPWEVWVYEGEIPLPPDADPKVAAQHPRLRRMLFLFVDEHGLGDYRLRYSTE